MKPIGNSASSDDWCQPNCTNLMPYQTKTSARMRMPACANSLSAALVRGLSVGQRSMSKCELSRMPIIAPSMIIQMKKKRAISSVQM